MVQSLLIAVGAGAAAALLFASLASGSLLALALFYLSPLPILIAALGWSHWLALVAAVLAAAGLGLAVGGWFFLGFLVGIGLPAWWLGYRAMLARQNPDNSVEWYPTGLLVLWAAGLGTAVIMATILITYGTDMAAFRSALHDSFAEASRLVSSEPADTPLSPETDRVLTMLAVAAPPAAAVMATIVNLMNLWLAGRIARVSDRLRRPWPDLAATALPRQGFALLVLGFVLGVLPGVAGVTGTVLVAAMLIAYAAAGLAVLHAITRGFAGRGLVLGGTYAVTLVLGWPVLGLSLLGLADSALDLRGRTRGPPARTDNVS